jgi:GNAT superfamily N-acetyltransferase
MEVRFASTADVPGIRAAYLDSWRAGYASILPERTLLEEADRRSEFDWDRAIANPESVVLVAERGGTIIGVAEIEHRPPSGRVPMLQMLYVTPAEWGSGVASDLLDYALAEAWAVGHVACWLRVVEPQIRARRFYEREGWCLDSSMLPSTNGLYPLLYYRRDQSVA